MEVASATRSATWNRSSASENVGHFLVRPHVPAVPSMDPISLYVLLPSLLVGLHITVLGLRRRAT
jgi:hypothetical protein